MNEYSKLYSKLYGKYDALGGNLVQALQQFLREEDIKVLSVSSRVKDKDSFLEKIDRKNYGNPFNDCEDLCGIRIICYYQSDVEKISKIISKEFEVKETQDKEELLEADQFGYRSTHFIVEIKKDWLAAPNYRGLEDLKAEIQVRTVLMHAWAEIQHKLAYKKKEHIPKQFDREFSFIAAKLEEADGQFERLRNDISNYKENIVEIAKSDSKEIEDIELNLDSLQAFLDSVFSGKTKHLENTVDLLNEFQLLGISMKEIISSYERVKRYLPQIEPEIIISSKLSSTLLSQTGMAKFILALTNDKYFYFKDLNFNFNNSAYLPRYIFFVNNWRKIIQDDENFKN